MIGATTSGADNVISGNGYGVFLQGAGTGNVVQGNKIGTDITGAIALGNTHDDVTIEQSQDTTIGGTAAGAANVISANGEFGIGSPTRRTTWSRATSSAPTSPAPSRSATSSAACKSAARPTTRSAGRRRCRQPRSRATSVLVSVLDNSGTDNLIQGNLIGTTNTGDVALGNGTAGIYFYSLVTSTGTTIGGTAAGAGNVISGNKYGI